MGRGRLQFVAVHWTLVLNGIGVSVLISLLPAVGRAAGIADPLVAMVQALSAFIWMFVAPGWARQSDRRGRRSLMLVGSFGFTIANLITAAAILLAIRHWVSPLAGLGALMLGRSLFGLIGLAGIPAAQAFVSERSAPERRARSLAGLSSAQSFGTVLGPALAPLLIGLPVLGLAGPMFLIAALGLLTLPLLAVLLSKDKPHAVSAGRSTSASERLWRRSDVRSLMAQNFLGMLVLTGVMQALGFLVIDTLMLPPSEAQPFVGWAMSAGALATLVAQLALIPLLGFAPRRLMQMGPMVALAGAMLLALLPGYGVIVVGWATLSLGIALARPGLFAAASLTVSGSRQGEVAGTLISAQSAGLVVGPMLSVLMYTLWQPLPFLAAALFLAVAAALALNGSDG